MDIKRILIYGVLAFAAMFYLMPLAVMLITSLKDIDEIRSGSLLSLPRSISF